MEQGGPELQISGHRVLRYSLTPRGRISDDCFETGPVPHSWLFGQVSAIVHHGGAGTTASALRAGKPSLVVPHMADQPGWGARIHELGCGPKPLKLRELSSEALINSLNKALREETVQRAAQVGHILSQEQGVESAVRFLQDSVLGCGAP